ncbi:DMT family transporter [Vagococcus silagei]|uniref:DMT family transporter n=1 Tax=Vagococcus silagei TaxID=2508885 RepID=A0A4S3B142_9ENTE|nr:DMT family transporter [Vagococcus silagei]THB60128.1 hypothetical protein ESZ54_12115 [Vagococcus silagei]
MLFVILGVLAGLFFPIQASINSRLGGIARNPIVASFTAFSVGSMVLIVLLLLFDRHSFGNLLHLNQPYLLVAGPIAGVIFNVASITLFGKIGATITTIITITGQLIMGLLIDNFGLLNMLVQPISVKRILGILLMLGALWLFQQVPNHVNQ